MNDDWSRVYPNVQLGANVTLHGPCVLGMPPRGREPGELPLVIGDDAVIRPFTTIYAGTTIGRDFQTGHCVLIREDNVIADGCSVGTSSVLEFGNRVGEGSRVHSGCFLELTTLGKHVFVGPNVVFTDDPHPMKCPRYTECLGGVTVEDYARIGANATLLPGVVVGKNAFVAAGSVVLRDVPPDTVVAGWPAKKLKMVGDLVCHAGFYEHPYCWPPYVREEE